MLRLYVRSGILIAMPILFFLFSVAALLVGTVLIMTGSQDIPAMIAFLISAVFIVGCALAAELSDVHKLMKSAIEKS